MTSPIYQEEGSGSSLIVKNIKVNNLEANIKRLDFLKIKSDINTEDVTNSFTVDQRLSTIIYTIYVKFTIISSIFPDSVYVKNATLTISDAISGNIVGSPITSGINQNVLDYITWTITAGGLNLCNSSTRNYAFKIEVDSDVGVAFTSVVLTITSTHCQGGGGGGGD